MKKLLREILKELKSINKKLSALTLNSKENLNADELTTHLDKAIHDTLSKFGE